MYSVAFKVFTQKKENDIEEKVSDLSLSVSPCTLLSKLCKVYGKYPERLSHYTGMNGNACFSHTKTQNISVYT